MTLAQDLDRLKELDPETSDRIDKHLEIEATYPDSDGCPNVTQIIDLVQGEIQRGCQRRGWTWTVRVRYVLNYSEPFYYTDIYDRNGRNKLYYVIGDSPAAAMLKAYLAALEAEGK